MDRRHPPHIDASHCKSLAWCQGPPFSSTVGSRLVLCVHAIGQRFGVRAAQSSRSRRPREPGATATSSSDRAGPPAMARAAIAGGTCPAARPPRRRSRSAGSGRRPPSHRPRRSTRRLLRMERRVRQPPVPRRLCRRTPGDHVMVRGGRAHAGRGRGRLLGGLVRPAAVVAGHRGPVRSRLAG